MNELGRLKPVKLRKQWPHEAKDFTNWLAQEENIELLSEEIGIDIEVLQTEASVGKFNVDILAQEPNTGRKIIIENQLESTDHDHLGKLITYASGHDAEISVWIVKNVREEHKQAINWLNEHSDEKTNFFVIRMELWQIGDSIPAPKFHVIASPNEWAKTLKASAQKSELTDTKIMQRDFWEKFKEYVTNKGTRRLKLRSPRPQHWYNLAFGYSQNAHLALTVDTRKELMACEVYIHSDRAKEIFDFLNSQKKDIEKELSMKLEWMKLPTKKVSRIKISHSANLNNSEDWNKYFDWLQETAEKFHKVFGKNFKFAMNELK